MVWSDPEIIKLSAQFVTVADEVYMLYPEDPGNLNRVKNDPAHLFFKKFGEAMPKGDWNHPGTKQGIYMVGPDGEYLEGKFAGASNPADILARMKRALQKWETLRVQKNYANLPVPAVKTPIPPGYEGEVILRVNSRDLPRRPGDQSGRRITQAEKTSGGFLDFTKWAWNESWVSIAKSSTFVPQSNRPESIAPQAVRKIAREALIDNVRGQNPEWKEQDIKAASMTMRRITTKNGIQIINYTGSVNISDGNKTYQATCYGEGEFNPQKSEFARLDIVWTGMRSGSATFNQRTQDRDPAPMGITLSLHKQ